ncbi:MAG: hypothetical protein RI935_21 [Candidatus Parcubacteria bacterium]|jgi:very-short-patch-repair endonuclease
MPLIQSTPQALLLASELKALGVDLELEYWDGHKHIDIYIPKAKIALEIDGAQHYLNASQIDADFHRDYFSNKEDIFVKHIPNILVETHAKEIAEAIVKVISNNH